MPESEEIDPDDQLARRARHVKAAMRELRLMTLASVLLSAGSFWLTTKARMENAGAQKQIVHFYCTVVSFVISSWGLIKTYRSPRFLKKHAVACDLHYLAFLILTMFNLLTLLMMLRL